MPNRSHFYNTSFTVDPDYRGSDDFEYHVKMAEVSGVDFVGCSFDNLQTTITESDKLGYGIESFDAKYTVKASCETPFPFGGTCATSQLVHTKFTGLDHGIHATGGFNASAFQVEDGVFTDNVCGVYSNGVVGFKVANCVFNVGGSDVSLLTGDVDELFDNRHRAIFSTEGYGFIIDENEIHQSGENLAEGIVVGYSRDHNDKVFGNAAFGVESAYIGEGICASTALRWGIGLSFLCDKNFANEINFWSRRVDADANTEDQTIRTNQGGLTRAPDNAFDRQVGLLDFKNTNLSNTLLYWWAAPEAPYKPQYVSAGIGLTNGLPGNTVYRPANNCLSRRVPRYPYPYPSIPSGHKSILLQHKADHANNWFLYKQLLDGGSTDEVLEDLQANWSDGAWAMRDYLLGISPYLSVDALKAAMSKPDFPAAMKAEVCIANPDAVQKEGFMKWLRNECPYAPGESLLETIEASWDTKTYRTQLEATLAYDHAEMTQAANLLLQYHQSDTVEHVDSLRGVWQLIRTPAARYAEALTYVQEKQFAHAIAVVESIPLEHDLRDKEESERGHMLDLLNAFADIHAAQGSYAKMTTGDVAAVEAIIGTYHDRATNWAQNILCWYHGKCRPPWTGGEMGDNTPKARHLANSSGPIHEPVHLRLYPNPSSNWTTAEIDLATEPKNAALVVQDIAGRVLQRLVVGNRATQLVLDSRSLAPGSYRVDLFNDGTLLHSEILIIRQ